LVGEAVGHDETRVAGGATEIHQPAFGQQVNAVAAGKGVFVHLRLDVELGDALGIVQLIHLNLVVEVADVADDGLVLSSSPCVRA